MFKLTKQQQQQLNTLIIKLLQWCWDQFRTIIIATPEQWGVRIERFARLCAIIVAFIVAAASFTYKMGYKCGQMLHQFNDWWTQTTVHQAFRSKEWQVAMMQRLEMIQLRIEIIIDDAMTGAMLIERWYLTNKSHVNRLRRGINHLAVGHKQGYRPG